MFSGCRGVGKKLGQDKALSGGVEVQVRSQNVEGVGRVAYGVVEGPVGAGGLAIAPRQRIRGQFPHFFEGRLKTAKNSRSPLLASKGIVF